MFIDNIPATIILTPILLPIAVKFGMSPITFGIMLTMNLAIGFCTPPYGINLFVASAISKGKNGERNGTNNEIYFSTYNSVNVSYILEAIDYGIFIRRNNYVNLDNRRRMVRL